MHREYQRWYSSHLGRDMEMLVFGDRGARVVVFPTREGRFYDYENFGLVAALREPVEQGQLQLFCVDSLDSETFYCRRCPPQARIQRHRLYERYLLEEVLPFTRQRNPQPFCIAHGCSIGAYHALSIAFRFPGHFGKVVALSGRYDLTITAGRFRDLMQGHYDEDVYFHMPSHFVPNLHDEGLLSSLRRMEIALVIGREDPFYENNRALSRSLHDKGIGHRFDEWDGEAHRMDVWRQMVRCYL